MSKADSKHTPAEILRAARELISDEKNWTQGVFARDACGRQVFVWEDTATCFCSIGAIAKVTGAKSGGQVDHKVLRAIGFSNPHRLAVFNDGSTHAEVLSRFDRAIAKAEGRAQ